MALKWTLEKMIKFIEDEGYIFIKHISGIGKESRMLIWCGNPEHNPYEVIFNNFKRGTRCDKCVRRKWTDLKIKEYIEFYNYKLIKIVKSKGIQSIITIQCLTCGHKYTITFGNFKNGSRCMECFLRENRTSKDEIRKIVKENGDNLINILEYHSLESILLIYCDNCGENYKIRFDTYLNGGRCNICNESKGERRIRKYLEKIKLKFEKQYRDKECRCKYPLPFDFMVKLNNGIILIEYDGLEHYQPVKYFGGIDKFIDRKIRDTIKNWYCEQNNIKLIRIPYWEYENIEKILKKELC